MNRASGSVCFPHVSILFFDFESEIPKPTRGGLLTANILQCLEMALSLNEGSTAQIEEHIGALRP